MLRSFRSLLTVATLLAAPAAASAAPPTREAAVAQWQAISSATAVPAGWTGSRAACAVGAESAASIDATLRTVNALRDFAGLAPIRFDPVLNGRALAAALMMDAAGTLSHTPGLTWPCYTADGAAGAARSSLYLGSSGAAAMVGYVEDAGVPSLGHRLWLLDRRAAVFGTGSTGNANALYVASGSSVAPSGPEVVSWPPPGWVPWPLIPVDWSAEFPAGFDLSRAQVSVRLDGQPRAVFGVRVLNDGFGFGTPVLAWNVALDAADRSGDRTLDVYIDGLVRNGIPGRLSYQLRTFPADAPASATPGFASPAWPPAVQPTGPLAPTRPAAATPAPSFSRAPRIHRPRALTPGQRLALIATVRDATRVRYQWLRNGRPIRGATRRSYTLRSTDRGRALRCRVTAAGAGGRAVRTTAAVRITR